jgi:hypothetical protein
MEFDPTRDLLGESLDLPPPPSRFAEMGGQATLESGQTRESGATSKNEAVQKVLTREPIDLIGRFERISEADQIIRMRFFANLIVDLARACKPFGAISSGEAVSTIADHFGVPVSDVNYGLLFAIRSRRLVADDVTDGDTII